MTKETSNERPNGFSEEEMKILDENTKIVEGQKVVTREAIDQIAPDYARACDKMTNEMIELLAQGISPRDVLGALAEAFIRLYKIAPTTPKTYEGLFQAVMNVINTHHSKLKN